MFNKVTVFAAILALGLVTYANETIGGKIPIGPTKIKECGTLSEPGSYVVVQNLSAVYPVSPRARQALIAQLGRLRRHTDRP